MLYRGNGTAFEHAIFLCDLLLGLGLDAYVCIGGGMEKSVSCFQHAELGWQHAWVVTITDPDYADLSNASSDIDTPPTTPEPTKLRRQSQPETSEILRNASAAKLAERVAELKRISQERKNSLEGLQPQGSSEAITETEEIVQHPQLKKVLEYVKSWEKKTYLCAALILLVCSIRIISLRCDDVCSWGNRKKQMNHHQKWIP